MRYYIDEFRKLTITKNKIRDKERFLSGDFSEEVKNIETELNLDHISNGTQFELYLERLFRRLGYRVKHLGKSGDQGVVVTNSAFTRGAKELAKANNV